MSDLNDIDRAHCMRAQKSPSIWAFADTTPVRSKKQIQLDDIEFQSSDEAIDTEFNQGL